MNIRMAATVAAAAGLVFAGWTMRSWYDGAREAERLAAEAKAREQMIELANTVATKTEAAIGGIRIENRTIYNKVQREILREPVYRNCRLTPDGVRALNEARRGRSASEPNGKVPARSANP